ncbi:response regulator [Haliangium ochraceum]|uniref:Response regulator receiver protein n=1 Tax=Haliangium ochraceum (strain DSM 14365 / JCM 11303 / SMP-2) TaxID=502025 RepID=D0LY87_HALO1|nr:response regulator [Haliangium ochraceum]ACY16237.1 response regulator receiver protein [Haliangium ochraceum DSM 14365]
MRDPNRSGEARDQAAAGPGSQRGDTSDAGQHAPSVERFIRQDASESLSFTVAYHDAADWLADFDAQLCEGGLELPLSEACEQGASAALHFACPDLLQTLSAVAQLEPRKRSRRQPETAAVARIDAASRAQLAEAAAAIRERDRAWLAPLVRVLVVEDNLHAAQLLEDGLHLAARRSFGNRVAFHVPRVTTRSEAIAFLRRKPVDALIIDMYLQGETGAALIEQLRAEPALAKLPVIVISAGHDAHTRDTALNAGADLFLTKPLRMRELARAIADALELELD